jgi:MYXO-CTERM domain-containing protein
MFFGTIDGIGVPGTTVWVGMIVSGGTANAGDETQYHLYDGARTDATSLALGDQNKDGEVVAMLRGGNVAQWGFERTCGHSACTTGTAAGYFATNPVVAFGGTHWSVTRFVFGATTTEITMWRDPAPGSTDPADASALVLTPFGGGTAAQKIVVPALFFDTIAPNASGNFNYVVDEIRIATTFAELGGGGMTVGNDAGAVDAGAAAADGGLAVDGGGASSDAMLTLGDAGPNAAAGAPAGCGCAASRQPSVVELLGGLGLLALLWRRRTPKRQTPGAT